MAVAASRTTNPWLLLALIAVVFWVGMERRDPSTPNVLPAFLVIGLAAVAFRLVMVMVFGGGVAGATVLFTLPEVPLPEWLAGARIGGRVALEPLLQATWMGLQLAAILVCFGAANVLASPRRLLRYLPATLYEVGTAVVVAMTFVPQLIDDGIRVRQARRLRGRATRSPIELGRLVVPVLSGALDRSLALAASMESRGYGRVVVRTPTSVRAANLLTLTGVTAVLVSLYGLLDANSPAVMGLPLLAAGLLTAVAALVVGASRDRRSHYRREEWGGPDWLVAGSGLVAATLVVLVSLGDGADLNPIGGALPGLPPWALLAVAIGALPGLLAPEVSR